MYRDSTEKSYNVYRKKFSDFLTLDAFDPTHAIPVVHYTDANIANFLNQLGTESEFKPHILKTAKAALNSDLKTHGRRGIQDDPEFWKLTTLEIQVIVFSSFISYYIVIIICFVYRDGRQN